MTDNFPIDPEGLVTDEPEEADPEDAPDEDAIAPDDEESFSAKNDEVPAP